MRTPTILRALLPCLLACAAVAAALPATAGASASDERIFSDCQGSPTGALTGSYPKVKLRHALRNFPADLSEYTGCYDAIRQALLSSGGGNGGGGGGGTDGDTGSSGFGGIGGASGSGSGGSGASGPGTGAPGAPGAPAHTGTEAPVEIAGAPIEPGELPSIGQDAHALPSALVVMLALLGLAALAAAALTIGRRVVARRRA